MKVTMTLLVICYLFLTVGSVLANEVVVRYSFRGKFYEMPKDEAVIKQIMGRRFDGSVVKRVYDSMNANEDLKRRIEVLYNMRYPAPERIFITVTHQSNGTYAKYVNREITIDEQDTQDSEDVEILSLLAHEFAHVVDPTTTSLKLSEYGPDEEHSYNEVTTPHAAWCEGWAEFNETLVDEPMKWSLDGAVNSLKKETASGYAKVSNPTHSDYIATEGVVGAILFGLLDDDASSEHIDETFKNTGDKPTERDIQSFLITLCEHRAANRLRAIVVYDIMTNFTAATDQLETIFGAELTQKFSTKREQLPALFEKSKNSGKNRFDFIPEAMSLFDGSGEEEISLATAPQRDGEKGQELESMELVGTLSNF